MTDKAFASVVTFLRSAYRQQDFLGYHEQLEVWFGGLEHLEYKDVQQAVKRWVGKSPYPPTIADILSCVEEIRSEEKDEMNRIEELWDAINYPNKTEKAKKVFFDRVYGLPGKDRTAGARWLCSVADRELGTGKPLEEVLSAG